MAKAREKPLFFGGRWSGISQLTFIEHALCPLDSDGPFERVAEYFYTLEGKRTLGTADINATQGLVAEDEFYLWGLLALTLSQSEGEPVLYASARYMLRQLGIGEGGKNLRLLRASLERLSGVRYRNDKFYDPMRRSHRRVAFGFLSYNLPFRSESIQGWNIYWDQAFFELCKNSGGFLGFDLQTYRSLSPASRRLFLLLSKYFYPGKGTPRTQTAFHAVEHLAVHGLGYSSGMETKIYNQKLKRCVSELAKLDVVRGDDAPERIGKGKFRIRFSRGPYFDKKPSKKPIREKDAAVYETLSRIGLDDGCIRWVLREFPVSLVNQWADVTFAAMEAGHVRESPQQFFIHHIKRAKAGEITPPDWYRELERDRDRKRWSEARSALDKMGINPAGGGDDFERYLETDGRQEYVRLVAELTRDYRRSGADEGEAREQAEQYARRRLKPKFFGEQQGPRRLFT